MADFNEERERRGQNQKSDPGVTIIRGTQVSGPGARDGSVTSGRQPQARKRGRGAGKVRSSGNISKQIAEIRGHIAQLQSPQGAVTQGSPVVQPPPQNAPTPRRSNIGRVTEDGFFGGFRDFSRNLF